MNRASVALLAALILSGCQSPKASAPATNTGSNFAKLFGSDRLKALEFSDMPISVDQGSVLVSGMWLPDDIGPAKPRNFADEVSIACNQSEKDCEEVSVSLGASQDRVAVMTPEESHWYIQSWNADGLTASQGPSPHSPEGSPERCQFQTITMTFASGLVFKNTIPVPEKGCQAFKGISTDRLVSGRFYIDTTPGNNSEAQDAAK